MLNTHPLRNLGRVELGIGLIARVRRSAGAALEEQHLSAEPPPSLPQHTGCRELRRRGKAFGPGRGTISCIGNQGKHLNEVMLIQVVIGILSGKAFLHHPVAVVQGKPRQTCKIPLYRYGSVRFLRAGRPYSRFLGMMRLLSQDISPSFVFFRPMGSRAARASSIS